MSTTVPLTKLTYSCLAVSLLLWLINNYISMSCDMIETNDERQDFFQGVDQASKEERLQHDTPQYMGHNEKGYCNLDFKLRLVFLASSVVIITEINY